VHHTTGLTREQLVDLVATIDQFLKKKDKKAGRPPVIGLFKSVVALLWYLRRNRAQVEIAELLGVSQSTVSRRITTLTPVLEEVLADYIPTLEDLPDKDTLVVDGSLLTCWSWADAPEVGDDLDNEAGGAMLAGVQPAAACTSPSR
jgi:DDE superfamily endonuclease